MLTSVIVLNVLTTIIVILSRCRKCPSDKILVIYGKLVPFGCTALRISCFPRVRDKE